MGVPNPSTATRASHRTRWKGAALGSSLALVLLAGFALTPVQAADPSPLRKISDPNPNFHGVWVDTVNNELAVSDDSGHSMQIFSRTASGTAAPLRTIQGLDTGVDFPSSVVVDTVNNEIWAVMNDTSDRAVAFSRTANGNVAPLRTVDFKALAIAEKRTYGWAVDTVNNEVAGTFQFGVPGTDNGAIYFFDRLGVVGVLRSISGLATTLADPHGLYDDTVNNEVVVTNWGHQFDVPPADPSVAVFSRTASGNVAPLRAISGALTGLNNPAHVFVDTANNELYVANQATNTISVFSRTGSGNVAPLRTISGALTGLNVPSGVFVDTVNNEVVVTNWGNHTVTAYSRTASGNVAPLRTLTSDSNVQVGIGNPGAAAVDLTNNEIAVTNCVSHPRIAFWSRTANGTVAPLRVIQGQSTRISRSFHGIAIDPVNNEVLGPSTYESAVLVFPRTANGDVAPLRVIQGSLTDIGKPQGLSVDVTNNEIAVANENSPSVAGPSITIYSRTANGNVAPLREITDAGDSLLKPVGVFDDPVDNVILVADGDSATPSIVVYPRTANGPTTPLQRITGSSTMLSRPRQVVVDTVNKEIIVANQGERALNPPVQGNIAVYNLSDNGNVAPKRFISGPLSGVGFPRSVWVDPVNNEIGEGDSKFNWIEVFPRVF